MKNWLARERKTETEKAHTQKRLAITSNLFRDEANIKNEGQC